jgi:hypothetical protein
MDEIAAREWPGLSCYWWFQLQHGGGGQGASSCRGLQHKTGVANLPGQLSPTSQVLLLADYFPGSEEAACHFCGYFRGRGASQTAHCSVR